MDEDGNVYISDSGGQRVRRVDQGGTITTVAGTGTGGFSGDGGPATRAKLCNPLGLALDPDGNLYIADQGCGFFTTGIAHVRKVSPSIPWIKDGEHLIPSEDGAELYHFDNRGKHLRTLDATTGTVLYQFSYDDQGRLSATEDVDSLTTTVERDASGNATAIVAPNGDRTELTLDLNGYLDSVKNPAGETVQLTYDGGGGGLLETLTDPKNNTTRFTYDEKGRLTKDEDPAGGYKALSRTEEKLSFTASVQKNSGRKNTYKVSFPGPSSSLPLPIISSKRPTNYRVNTDPSGLETKTTVWNDETRTIVTPDGATLEAQMGPDPRFGMQSPMVERATVVTPRGLGKTTTASRDVTLADPENPLSVTSITEKVTTGDRVSTSTWDKASNTITATSPAGRNATIKLDEKGRLIEETAAGFASTNYEYDERGRLRKEISGTGSEARTTTYTYDENGEMDRLTSVTDPLGREWHVKYDEAGRVEKEIAPSGQAVSYDYDENGNLTSITPPGQPAHEFGYDSRDLGTSYNAPQVGTEDRTTSNAYDLDRLPTSQTLPSGGKVEYSYDEGGRLQTMRYPGGEKTFNYDPNTGNPATASNASGTLSYFFDGFLPLAETSTGQVPGRVNFSYDNDLRVKGVRVNGGPEAAYSYDKDGLITKAGALDLSRDTRGLLSGTNLSNVTDKRSFNSFGEMQYYEALYGSNRLYESAYNVDSLGRIVEKTETIGGDSTTHAYTYDEEGNLKEVKQDGEVVASYAYEPNGNRLSRTTASGIIQGSYDAQDRLISYGTNEYAYTPDGKLKTKTDTATGKVTSYDYDALGNLLSVTLPEGKQVEYVVDAADRRVGRKVNGQLVQGFLYQGQLAPVAELDGSGNIVSRFVYATKENVPDYMEKNGKTYRIITDHVGSVRLVVDAATGEIAQRINYDEFGNVLEDTNPGFQPFGFAGGLYDPDTKLVRFGTRDYDAETGRWTAKDLIGFSGGDSNLYAYAMNDPVNLLDPDGLEAEYWYDWQDWDLSTAADFSTGFGRVFTFGLTDWVNSLTGADKFYSKCSTAARAGEWTAEALDLAMGIGGLAKSLGKKAIRKAGCNSFDADTPVLMADGTKKPISEVKADDEVMATDPETGETFERKVTDVIVGEGKKELVDVTIDGETVTATDEHPFFVSGDGRWVYAEDLEAGDRLLTPEGETVRVEAVRVYTEIEKVYNLTVEGVHTYYVEAGDGDFVLVHNTSCPLKHVYLRGNDYGGITNHMRRRGREHGVDLTPLTKKGPLDEWQARAVEETIISANPHFKNLRHSISPTNPRWLEALEFGEKWLVENNYGWLIGL